MWRWFLNKKKLIYDQLTWYVHVQCMLFRIRCAWSLRINIFWLWRNCLIHNRHTVLFGKMIGYQQNRGSTQCVWAVWNQWEVGAALLLLSNNKLIKMCQRTGSHFHDWIDYHRLNILGVRKFQLVEIKKWEDYSQEVLWLSKEYNIMGKGFLGSSSTYPA